MLTLFSCPQDAKEAAYKGNGEFNSGYYDGLNRCKNVQLGLVTRTYTFEECRMTGILTELK